MASERLRGTRGVYQCQLSAVSCQLSAEAES
jgi:hypothetical protein